MSFQGGLAVLRDGVLEIFPHNGGTALPIAVSTALGVRTAAGAPVSPVGARFQLDGTPLPPAPQDIASMCCWTDGATDGKFVYAIRNDSTLLEPRGSRPLARVALYRFDLQWGHPEELFRFPVDGMYNGGNGVYVGVAYSARTGSFWITRTLSEGAHIEQWSREGTLISASVNEPATMLIGIASDPADGTLWAISQGSPNRLALENFDEQGTRLGTFATDWPVPSTFPEGAEFAWIDRR